LRILSKTGLADFLLFCGELFLTMPQPPLSSRLDCDDAIAACEDMSMKWYPRRLNDIRAVCADTDTTDEVRDFTTQLVNRSART
jgi:hypothetical protein